MNNIPPAGWLSMAETFNADHPSHVFLSLSANGKRRVAKECHHLANEIERVAFTEPGHIAGQLKKAASKQRARAIALDKIAAQFPEDPKP